MRRGVRCNLSSLKSNDKKKTQNIFFFLILNLMLTYFTKLLLTSFEMQQEYLLSKHKIR